MPANGEQGRRVLDEDGERRQGASAHEVELAARPLLYTRARDLGVGGATHRDRALEECALAPRALDQRHVRTRERHGQWQPGKSRAGPDIGDGPGGAHHVELEGRERVSDVNVDAAVRVAHGGGGGLVVAKELEQPREALALVVAEPVSAADLVQSRAPAQAAERKT